MGLNVTDFVNSVLVQADNHGDGLAAIAALVGIPLVLWQIFQGARHERARAKARRYAALAALPMTLSGINVWAKQVVQAFNAIYPWVMRIERDQPAPTFQPPPSPNHLISAIEQMIEAAPGDRIGKTLAAIVSDIQVLNSRIGDETQFGSRYLRTQSGMIDSNYMLAAQIYARAESLYEASRSLSEDAPLDYDRVALALNMMEVPDRDPSTGFAAYPTARKMVEKAYLKALQRRRGYEKVRDFFVGKWRAWKKGN